MELPYDVNKVKTINKIKHEINVRKEFITLLMRSLKHRKEKKEDTKDVTKAIEKFQTEISILDERLKNKLKKSERKKYDFPIIDVPASGVPIWWEGAYTLCFVYSKHNGNFILRGWRGEVMDYLEKNYTHYFCYVSMWCNGVSRGNWKFWKKNVSIFEPRKKPGDWKYKVIKFDGGGIYNSRRVKELSFKRLPKGWIKEFDEL